MYAERDTLPMLTIVGERRAGLELAPALSDRGVRAIGTAPDLLDLPGWPLLLLLTRVSDASGGPLPEFDRLRPLEAVRGRVLNPPSAIWIGHHPELTARVLDEEGIPHPSIRLARDATVARRLAASMDFCLRLCAPCPDDAFQSVAVSSRREFRQALRRAKDRPWFETSGVVVEESLAATARIDVLVVDGVAASIRLASQPPARHIAMTLEARVPPTVSLFSRRAVAAVGGHVMVVRLLVGRDRSINVSRVEPAPEVRWMATSRPAVDALANAARARQPDAGVADRRGNRAEQR